MRNPVLSTCVAAERSRRMNIDSPYAIGLAPSRPTRSAPRTAPSRVPIDRCKEGVQASLNDGCAITRVVIGAQNVADSQPNRATNSDRTAHTQSGRKTSHLPWPSTFTSGVTVGGRQSEMIHRPAQALRSVAHSSLSDKFTSGLHYPFAEVPLDCSEFLDPVSFTVVVSI